MDTSASVPSHLAANLTAGTTPARVHSSIGLGLGGFFGGPLAISYLIYRDLVSLGRTNLLPKAAAWFIPCILLWGFFLLRFPPDPISQWIPYLPQTVLWWLIARHLFGRILAQHVAEGGEYKSRWQAVRFGFFTFLGLKVVFFCAEVLAYLWAS